MTLHLYPIEKPKRQRCDTKALAFNRERVHRDLRNEIAEARMSAIIVEKRNRHIRDSNNFKQNGGIDGRS